MKELAATFDIHHSFTPVYHPQANPVKWTIGRYHGSHLQRYLHDEDEDQQFDPERVAALDRELLKIEG